MKSERLRRTKSVMASSAIALVIAALVMGLSSLVLGPKSASSQRLGFDLTSGSSSFTITSSIYNTPSGTYPATSCSGTPAVLSPNVIRCVVFSVHNNLKATISVQSITAALDTTNYPAPPADCSGTNLMLPTFSGSFNVTGGGNATSPGVPIELKDNDAPQTDCENYAYHFVYTGGADYTEVYGTSTGVASSQNPSTAGQSVTYTATVTASATASQDPVPSSPTGTVTFQDNGTTICNAVALTSTGTTTATARCAMNYATTAGSPHSITASYVNTDGNSTSSNGSLTQVVNSSTVGTSTSLTSSANPSTYGSSVTFTATVSPTSGSRTPAGTVTFYGCTTSGCTPTSVLGTGTLNSSGKATLTTSALPVGTTYVVATYGASGNYLGSSSSPPLAQVVKALSTSTSLTSSANPSTYGSSVTFTATVSPTSGSRTPAGTVTFYGCTTSGCTPTSVLGTGTLNSSGKATLTTSALPVGTTYVVATYGASGNYLGSSSSPPLAQVVIGVPSVCASNGYGTVIIGSPGDPFLSGTNGNDFIYAFGASYWINGFGGNDCIDAGDGNNVIYEGDGNDGVSAGNGSDSVFLGDGNDKVSLGNGSDGVNIGDGNDTVTVGNGSDSDITVGNGNDTVTVGTGSSNDVNLGSGTDTVTVHGSRDDIDGEAGNETIYLGSGTYNTYRGVKGKTNLCHLPLYNGKPGTAAEYHDTLTNCTVVSP